MNKTLIAATVAGIVLLASNAQAQTVPEGYQLQQVLMMSRITYVRRWRTMAVCWSSRRRINGPNGTSPWATHHQRWRTRSVYGALHA